MNPTHHDAQPVVHRCRSHLFAGPAMSSERINRWSGGLRPVACCRATRSVAVPAVQCTYSIPTVCMYIRLDRICACRKCTDIPCWKFRLSHSVHGDLSGPNGFPVPESSRGWWGSKHTSHNPPMANQHFRTASALVSFPSLCLSPLISVLSLLEKPDAELAPHPHYWQLVHGIRWITLKIALSDSIHPFPAFSSSSPPLHSVNYLQLRWILNLADGNRFSLSIGCFPSLTSADRLRSFLFIYLCIHAHT